MFIHMGLKANTVDPDETAHKEPSHLDLSVCKFSYCFVWRCKGFKYNSVVFSHLVFCSDSGC